MLHFLALSFALALVPSSVLGASASSPAVPPENAKAIRTLVYRFDDIAQGTFEGHSSGIGSGYSHVASGITSGAWHGTITVEVLGLTTNGGLNVRMTEAIDLLPRKLPTWLCATYPSTAFECSRQEDPDENTTASEDAVLEFLEPAFVNGSILDDRNHWRTTVHYTAADNTTPVSTDTTDFTVAANPNKVLDVTGQRTSLWWDKSTEIAAIHLRYDLARMAPLRIHVEEQQHASSVTVDAQLIGDSFAPVPSH